MRPDFPLSTLAHISAGYSAGSIYTTVTKVLTDERRKNIENRPLQIAEFIGPLSLTSTSLDTDYESFSKFTDYYTGDGDRREKLLKALNDDDDSGGKDKKKKKKKK